MFESYVSIKSNQSKRIDLRNIPSVLYNDYQYTVKIADSVKEIDKALCLRFEVFNLELGEGLDDSYLTSRDLDEYDKQCLHLIIIKNDTGKILGTYRLQTYDMAIHGKGFYSAGEFSIENLPYYILEQSVELGRACISKNHRNSRVLFLLWCGIANILEYLDLRYLFGCGSLTSQNNEQGWKLYNYLLTKNHVNLEYDILPRPEYTLSPIELSNEDPLNVIIPPLMRMYIRYGSKVIGLPAIDREFKTIDYFLLFDKKKCPDKSFRLFIQSTFLQ